MHNVCVYEPDRTTNLQIINLIGLFLMWSIKQTASEAVLRIWVEFESNSTYAWYLFKLIINQDKTFYFFFTFTSANIILFQHLRREDIYAFNCHQKYVLKIHNLVFFRHIA